MFRVVQFLWCSSVVFQATLWDRRYKRSDMPTNIWTSHHTVSGATSW